MISAAHLLLVPRVGVGGTSSGGGRGGLRGLTAGDGTRPWSKRCALSLGCRWTRPYAGRPQGEQYSALFCRWIDCQQLLTLLTPLRGM